VGRRSAPAAEGDYIVRLDHELRESLERMADLANCKLGTYVMELVVKAIADFRAQHIESSFLDGLNDNTPPPGDMKPRRGRFSAEDREKINAQHDAGTGVAQLATRWHCGASTIRRLLD